VDATTNANSFYSALVRAVNSVSSNRYLPANAVIMNPQRWAWVLEAVDSSGRPIVAPSGASFNALATADSPQAEGSVGNLLGLPVYLDPNIPQTMNSATNQDAVFVLRTDDVWLFESSLETASFDATYADNASILFRVLGYSALIPDRYAASTSVILGTGLVTATL
jgi:HK97 family phage major capsid protein